MTVLHNGDYQLILGGQHTSTVANVAQIYRVSVDGTPLPGAQTKTFFIKNANGHNHSSATLSLLLRKLQANQVVTVDTIQEGATGVTTS